MISGSGRTGNSSGFEEGRGVHHPPGRPACNTPDTPGPRARGASLPSPGACPRRAARFPAGVSPSRPSGPPERAGSGRFQRLGRPRASGHRCPCSATRCFHSRREASRPMCGPHGAARAAPRATGHGGGRQVAAALGGGSWVAAAGPLQTLPVRPLSPSPAPSFPPSPLSIFHSRILLLLLAPSPLLASLSPRFYPPRTVTAKLDLVV